MRTLLLADDNITVQRVIALTFAHEPVRIVTASDGHQAMDRVMVDRPDIVLAGTTLPQVNGYELARFVKSRAELKNVPVLLLSGAFETVDEAQLKASGANGVIEKPVEPTTVISRVKELLGIKSEGETVVPAGRLVTPGGPTPENRPAAPGHPTTQTTHGGDPGVPTLPRVVTSTRPLPVESRREPSAAQPDSPADKGDDYLESLESAFDTLDQQLAGRLPAAPKPQRNPSPPIGRVASGDPRSPGKPPSNDADESGNPVYEIDDEWFAESPVREDARAARRDIVEDLHAPELQAEPSAPEPASAPVYEVDDEWFAEDRKAREARDLEQKQLAAEMGIHEVELPPVEPLQRVQRVEQVQRKQHVQHVQHVESEQQEPKPPSEQHVEEIVQVADAPDAPAAPVESEEGATEFEPIARTLPIDWFAMGSPKSRLKAEPLVEHVTVEVRDASVTELRTVAPLASSLPVSDGTKPPATPGRVADDFAALLAFEQGEKTTPPMIEPIIHTVTPEITPEMLDQIAATVADRLKGSIHVEPQAPELTGEMLKTIAFLVSGHLRDQIRVEPAAPEFTDAMLEGLAFSLADRLKDSVRVAPVAPEISGAMLDEIAATVSARLHDTVRENVKVESVAPELSGDMLEHIAHRVSERVQAALPMLPRPEISEAMLNHVALSVSDRVQAVMPSPSGAPQISDEMLDRVAARVADRMQGMFSMEGLRESIAASVRDTVRAVVSETSERLVREEIERIKNKTP